MYNINDKSEAVRAVQEYLGAVYPGSVRKNGIFDKATERAVNKFKEANALSPDGKVDYKTHTMLYDEYKRNLLRKEIRKNNSGYINFPITVGSYGMGISELNLMLKALLDYFGKENGIRDSRVFSHEGQRGAEALFRIFGMEQKNHVDELFYKRLRDEYAFLLKNSFDIE